MDELLVDASRRPAETLAGDSRPALPVFSPRTYNFFDVALSIDGDDCAFADEFERVFGRGDGGHAQRGSMHVTVRAADDILMIDGDGLDDPAGFLAGFSSPDIPLSLAGPGEVRVGDDPEPVFRFRESVCEYRKVGGWRRIVAHMIFLRLIRLRPDLLFFHAASVGIAGRAFLLIGPKGRGKTTISLALAARGHDFLGDETAVVDPAAMVVHPFRRPVGIKRGPASAAVTAAMADVQFSSEGMVRMPVGKLLDVGDAKPLPLGGVGFLQPFADETRVEFVQAGREELSQMQPLASSFGGGAASSRVFGMIRLLGAVRCFRIWPSQPDRTAADLEEALR